jgi:6-pyruvoyltetrahydropterin/6-carboxytetrahydropterin synthase
MYRVSVEDDFDAAHYLRGYQGRCEALHGHRYRVRVTLKANALNEIDLAYDFTLLKKHLREILADYDHTCINDVPPFTVINASAENIARTVYEALATRLDEPGVALDKVEVWESPTSRVTYSRD